MTELNREQYSNESLLLIVSHEELFNQDLVNQAKEVWESRDLSKSEIETLVKIQVDAIGASQNLSNAKKSPLEIVPVLQQYGIDESIAAIYARSLKPKGYLKIVVVIFILFVILRIVLK